MLLCSQFFLLSLKDFRVRLLQISHFDLFALCSQIWPTLKRDRSVAIPPQSLQQPPEKIVKRTICLTLKEYDEQLEKKLFNEKIIADNILGNFVTVKFLNKTIQLPKNLALKSQYIKSLMDNYNNNSKTFFVEIIQNYSDDDIEKLVNNLIRKSKKDEDLDIIKFFNL